MDGEKGKYFRSRSGWFFCFFQQKIELGWLYEQHNYLFKTAKKYEKEGFPWSEDESLEELSRPERIKQIKREHLNRMKRKYEGLTSATDWHDAVLGTKKTKTTDDPNWIEELMDAEGDGCASCFI